MEDDNTLYKTEAITQLSLLLAVQNRGGLQIVDEWHIDTTEIKPHDD